LLGNIKNQVKIHIQPSYALNSSISAQSTVRFGSIFVNARSSGEKLTVFVNLYVNMDYFVAFLPGGRPQSPINRSQIPWRGILRYPVAGFYHMNISALNFNPARRNVNLILEHNNKEWLLRYPFFYIP